MPTIERLLAQALQLPPEDREQLVEAILESLPTEIASGEFSDEEKAELDRRIAAADANPSAGYTWEEVKARHSRQK